MRTGIGIAVVVAIGLIWSVAVMSQWVPVASPKEVGHAYPALRPLPPADLHRAAVPAMKA